MSLVVDRRADDLVTDEFRRLSSEIVPGVAARLDAVGARFSIREVDGFHNQAWHALFSTLQAEEPPRDRAAFLTEATYRRGVDEFRSLNPDRRLDSEVLEAVGIQDPIGETAEQQRALADVSEKLRAGSGQRELQPDALRIVHGMPAMDVWDRLGVPLDRLEAVVAAAESEISAALEGVEPGDACVDQLTLVNGFALGAFDPRSDGYRDAVAHLKTCAGCRRHALAARAIAAAVAPSGQMLVALTGSASLGPGATVSGPAPGAPRAASPLAAKVPARRPNLGKVVAWVAVAAVLLFGIVTVFGSGGGAEPAADTAAVSNKSAAEKSKAKAAKERREARAAKKRRAERRAKKRRAAARKRAAARRAAAARARANAQAATPVTTPKVVAPQTTTQPQTQAPAPKPQPKPSTDPSEEFGN